MKINELTIKSFHAGLMKKDFSAFEAVREFLNTIKEKDSDIKAFLSVLADRVLAQANEVDIDIARGDDIGMLAGIPLAIKDNILINGEQATAGSRLLENYTASYDATVISKLKKEKAVFLGKTNLDEFAMGSSTENSGFFPTRNPYDLERVPGGSSGGSAAAVAGGMALGALGSDTGGSIRQPAGFCGVVGLKPTYGAVSRYGLIALASSLDQIGPFAKTVEDAEILFNAIHGKDSMDATTVESESETSNLKLENCLVGLPKEYFAGGLDRETEKRISEAIQELKNLGVRFKEISLPHTKYALSVYYIILPAEASSNLARFDGVRYSRIADLRRPNAELRGKRKSALDDIYFNQRGAGFGLETKRRILLGTFVLSHGYYDAYYAKAQKVRRLIKEDFDRAFDSSGEGVDLIFAPTSPTLPFRIGEKANDPLSMYLSDIFTIPVNLAGLPGISIPTRNYAEQNSGTSAELRGSLRESASLPVGFQLIGKPFHESDLFEIGKAYESATRH